MDAFCNFHDFIIWNVPHNGMCNASTFPAQSINTSSIFTRTGSQYTFCLSDFYCFVHRMLIIEQGLLSILDN